MQHFSTAHIDTHMGNARCIISTDEKDQVAGSCVGRGYRGGNVVESLGSQPARIADAALRQHPGHEAGAIKRSVRIAATPDIRIADVLLCLRNKRRKSFIFQCGRRNIIGGGWFGVLVYIAGAWEQIFPVSQRCHIDRIQGKCFFVHDVDRHMGKIEVFQLHLTDIVVIRYFHVIVVSLAVCPCLRPIAYLHLHGLRQDVLLFKEHLQLRLNLVDGKHPFMERRENRDQHIRVMLDLVQVKTVFVISGVQRLIVIQFILKFLLQFTVGRLRSQHIRILGKIRGSKYAAHAGACHHGTGRYPAKQQGNTGANADHQQHRPAMMLDVEKGFLEGVLCFLCRTFRRGRCVLCGFLCLSQLLCIVPLDPLFLQKAGHRVRSCQCRIIMQCLLVEVLGICLDRSLLCLRCVTPGLCAVMVNGGTDFTFTVGNPTLRQHLALVSGLNTHIFLFHLMHLRMGGVDDLMDRPGKRIVPQASVGAFLHFFKVKLRFAFSGCLVKNTLGTKNFLCGDSGLCRVQPIRRTVGTVDVLSKCGIGTFFLGKLQTGGRALPCGRTIPHRLGVSLFRLSCAFLLMVFRRTQGKVSRSTSGFFRRSGQLRFRLPAADMFYLSRGKIFRYRTVTGHFLRDLIGCFQFPHRQSPSFP